MKNVSIIEGCPVICGVLRSVITDSRRYRCLPTYADVRSAREGLIRDAPDIVIFEIELPDGCGIECVRWLKPRMAKTEFMAFTGRQDSKAIFNALSAGATGYLCKGIQPAEVIDALDNLSKGGSPFSPIVSRKVVQAFSGRSPPSTPLPDSLSRREREILAELVQGYMLKEIQAHLGISQGTLNTHTTNLYRKLGVHSRNEIMPRYYPSSAQWRNARTTAAQSASIY